MSRPFSLASRAALALATALACLPLQATEITLSGDQEVPAVRTAASGTSLLEIAADGTVSGSVHTRGVEGTAAHVHQAPAGRNGPVVIPLAQAGAGRWVVPEGTRLSPAQLGAWKAHELYVNVHSAAHPGGEIRAQLKP